MRTIDVTAVAWRRSSYSNADGGECVEMCDGFTAGIPVRDSKTPGGPVLVFPAGSWAFFLGTLKTGPSAG
ncbi:DUF397 domain-containing protein [Streptomyces sp. YIM 98790]|uniref:DUF397 domain-containing protein n=1 Tax=Streptomyces sp. YIM 98790 TaxID=2689077 RepID=UPI00140D1F38|nr:DUF397 domain-containing protein [Streptomyces sp. YIM 98790]